MSSDHLKNHEVCQKELKSRKKDGVEPSRLKGREYLARNSLLTDMFEISHIRTIYNIFMALFVILAVIYSLKFGRLDLGTEYIVWNLGNLSSGIHIWVYMTAATICVYECFYCWATRRAHFSPASLALKCWDYGWLSALIAYQVCFVGIPAAYIFKWQLGRGTTVAVTFEQMRMLMKSHAFVRSNTPRVLEHKTSRETSTPPCPSFSQFIYFLYCPTLVYRDSYPRTERIRWNVVAHHLLEVVLYAFYTGFVMQLSLKATFNDWGLRPVSLRLALYMVVSTFIPVCVAVLLFFYFFCHSWHNAAAEVMRFADRQFYGDWWNAKYPGELFRKWNFIVQDWLYEYVYLEVRGISSSTLVRNMTLLVISGLGHEYSLGMIVGYYHTAVPVLAAFMTVLYVLANITFCRFMDRNVVMWTMVVIGLGSLVALHTMEIIARVNCVKTQEGWADFFSFPRSLNCIPIVIQDVPYTV